jgi:acetolactate synthase regulatory subunit
VTVGQFWKFIGTLAHVECTKLDKDSALDLLWGQVSKIIDIFPINILQNQISEKIVE